MQLKNALRGELAKKIYSLRVFFICGYSGNLWGRLFPAKLVPVERHPDSALRGMHHSSAGCEHHCLRLRAGRPIDQEAKPGANRESGVGLEHHSPTSDIDGRTCAFFLRILK